VYGPDGKRIGQIPNANSPSAVIKYAVGIDLDPDGRLFVADRGANAVKIFKTDGSLVATIPVANPTSLVALSSGQFAVTTLTPGHLVRIMDERGRLIRSFGDPPSDSAAQAAKPLVNPGWISGDPAGNIYFSFVSLSDPTVRKYDRYGYSAYQASLSAEELEPQESGNNSRVRWGLNVTDSMGMGGLNGFGIGGSVGEGSDLGDLSLRMGPGRRTPSGDSTGLGTGEDLGNPMGGSMMMSEGMMMPGGMMLPGMGGPMMMSGGMFDFGMRGGLGIGSWMHGEGSEGGWSPERWGGGMEGMPHRFGRGLGMQGANGVVRITQRANTAEAKPTITAMGADPKTQELWAAVGDVLVHFDRNGERPEIYYLATAEGAPLRPNAILVETNRLLLAADPWGVFEFVPPEKQPPPSRKFNIVPQMVPPQQ
jgi:hypothetical protein